MLLLIHGFWFVIVRIEEACGVGFIAGGSWVSILQLYKTFVLSGSLFVEFLRLLRVR
ncbi:hypothetical protein Hanom_Chr16g01487541 [Helianthus anomalus]